MANDDDLSPDPTAPSPGEEGARAIVGILGESDDPDAVRLYLDLSFSKSYDIPRAMIVKREKLTGAQSPFGVDASIVWVRPGTVLKVRTTETRPVEHEFLAGDFTAAGSFTPIQQGAVPAERLRLSIQPCFTRIETICPTRIVQQCPQSRVGICPTQPTGCLVASECGPCRSVFVRCPSSIDACPSQLICDEGGFGGGDPFGF